jgi:2-oxo-3-hexenedioate decarboxylase
VKLGLTSWAKQEAMGVTEPLYGWITSGMIAGAGQPVDRQSLIQPRGAGDRLPAGPRHHRARDRHQRAGRHQRPSSPRWISSTPGTATTVSPCRTSSPTMPARDGSCSPPGPPTWSTCGWSAACCERGDRGDGGEGGHGHPAVAVAWLANCLGPRGERLRAGWLVLSGGLTAGAARTGPGRHGRTGRAGFGGGLPSLGVIRFPADAGWFG